MDKNICILERQFIAYLKKWLLGERIKFIKFDIMRKSELEEQYTETEENTYSSKNEDNLDWIDMIENESLFFYIKNLDEKRKSVIKKNLIQGQPLTEVAKELGISKQLANAYKKRFINDAKLILSK